MENMFCRILILFLLNIFFKTSYCLKCDRTPERVIFPKDEIDIYRYIIEIKGNPHGYKAESVYKISLKLNPINEVVHQFKEFTLSIENDKQDVDPSYSKKSGNIILNHDSLAVFSRKCQNTILQTSSVPKTEVSFSWRAPASESGCISIKATVVESKVEWFSDDGFLTINICEDESDDEDFQPPALDECCACDEAKYEMAFEGLWSRNTHPKDFPDDIWSTKFSEIIGASHSLENSFWKYGELASESMQLMAETANTTGIEIELKKKLGDTVRTIIKANELVYPDITGTTFTSFRVDNKNHLVSIVSKIIPSPDWIVGIADFELCQKDCTWVKSRSFKLYPWDIGTDGGTAYDAEDDPLPDPLQITQIKSEDSEEPIKAMARIRFTKIKQYEKECQSDEKKEEDSCQTEDWSDWSACSSPCGKGIKFRKRNLINPDNIKTCKVSLVEQEACFGEAEGCEDNGSNKNSEEGCELGEWSEWSSCSATCGKGTITRDRTFVDPDKASECSETENLQEDKECEGESESCEDTDDFSECPDLKWAPWTSCSVTCGNGTKTREVVSGSNEENEENNEEETENSEKDENESENEESKDDVCAKRSKKEEVVCYQPACEDSGSKEARTTTETTEGPTSPFGDIISEDQLKTTTNIISEPFGLVINCKVSKWSPWTSCRFNNDEECGKKGYSTRARRIVQQAINGGKPCPRKLLRRKQCSVPCNKDVSSSIATDNKTDSKKNRPRKEIDCVMTPWSQWSPCNNICGSSSIRQRTRSVAIPPSKNGKPCPPRIEVKPCKLPWDCGEKGQPLQY